MAGKLRITLRKSTIGQKPKIRASVETLGLRKLHHTVEHPDTPSVRGLVRSATHLLDVEEI
jgi:large subunit ribosomal protein L30